MGKRYDYQKARRWIEAGNRIVIINTKLVQRVEKELQITLKPLSGSRYMVMNQTNHTSCDIT